MCSDIYGVQKEEAEKRIQEITKILKMENFLYNKIGNLSTGQTQKVNIARCLVHNPKYYILDEATTGLDIISSQIILDFMKQEKAKGKTILYLTHYMEEAADADYVVIINYGQIAAEGTPLDLKNKYTDDFLTLYNVNEEEIKQLNLKYTKIHNGFKIEIPNTSFATKVIYN